MDSIRMNKILVVVIAILAVINVGSVVFVLLYPLREGPRPVRGGRDAIQTYIERELDFSEEQKAEFARLLENHFQRGDSMMQAKTEATKALFDLLQNDNVTDDQVREKARALGDLEIARSIGIFDHFRAVRALCTPQQKERFHTIVVEALTRGQEPPPRPR